MFHYLLTRQSACDAIISFKKIEVEGYGLFKKFSRHLKSIWAFERISSTNCHPTTFNKIMTLSLSSPLRVQGILP
jgi:hypothetical protein